ncbi:stretch-activated cation channel Mid1 [Lentinula aff. detonsa]|uniref:Stretch-activated cation channel Mid1 n=1 Tax=Lentinula aff. detonsa TaxID=2804958 RepID=A0AA38KEX5_9AGAR|nr:stretch-activated cation channel Mid1 [Lentinula aff. detonsa]
MLPETLLCLVNAALIQAATASLSINTITHLNFQDLPSPPTFSLPAAQNLTITVAFCSSETISTRFFLTNVTSVDDPGPDGDADTYEITVNQGLGTFSASFLDGGVLAIDGASSDDFSFEIGTSDSGPMHQVLATFPLLGDTTSNQALLFSPSFDPPVFSDPSYPNYTLPGPSLSPPSPPDSYPNFTLIISPTSSQTLTSLPQTACMIASQTSSGNIANESLWLRDEEGWRTQWILAGLSPQTNYTAYVTQDSMKLSGPLYFVTKSAVFACPLAAFLPYCPGVTYAIPLPSPDNSDLSIYDSTNLPSSISDTLIAYFTNFTTTLTTQACGRDYYSPLQTCADCQRAYFRWLCSVSFPRCGEQSPSTTTTTTASSIQTSSSTGIPTATSALQPQTTSSTPRNSAFSSMNMPYSVLLPCIETCQAADRACPNFLGFACPLTRFNANQSYGVGYIDGAEPDQQGLGVPGEAQDQWGNIWCNFV